MNQPSAENVERADAFMRRWSNPSAQFYPVMCAEVAQALQAVEDMAERRGAVKELRRIVASKDHFGLAERGHEWIAACLRAWANELEAATKETGEG